MYHLQTKGFAEFASSRKEQEIEILNIDDEELEIPLGIKFDLCGGARLDFQGTLEVSYWVILESDKLDSHATKIKVKITKSLKLDLEILSPFDKVVDFQILNPLFR
jgi:hypothetical protein